MVGIVQVSRILLYEQAKNKGIAGIAEDIKKDVKKTVES